MSGLTFLAVPEAFGAHKRRDTIEPPDPSNPRHAIARTSVTVTRAVGRDDDRPRRDTRRR